jgi:hypothetical protein
MHHWGSCDRASTYGPYIATVSDGAPIGLDDHLPLDLPGPRNARRARRRTSNSVPASRPTPAGFRRAARWPQQASPCSAAPPARRRVPLVPVRTARGCRPRSRHPRRANEILESASVFSPRGSTRPTEASAFIDTHRERFGVEPVCRTWACRRPPSLGARAASAARGPSPTSGCSDAPANCTRPTTAPTAMGGCGRPCCGPARPCHGAACSASCARTGSSAPSDAGSRGGRHGPASTHTPARTPCSVSSPSRRPTGCGWPTVLPALLGWEGVVPVALLIEAYSPRVVGWQLASHMRTTLVLDALPMALAQRRSGADVALVHHSERGSQCPSIDSIQTLADDGVPRKRGIGRRHLPQRAGRELQDRAHLRPRLADSFRSSSSPSSSNTGSFQPHPPVPSPRRHPLAETVALYAPRTETKMSLEIKRESLLPGSGTGGC